MRSGAAGLAGVAALSAALALGGCEPASTSEPEAPLWATQQAATVLERPRSPAEEDGIEIARWSIAADDFRIRRALARHSARGVAVDSSREALERNGFRYAVVRDADLASLLAELGGTTSAVTVWHGQVTTWREVASRAYEPMVAAARGSGPMAMVDGRAERLNGWLRLMARGWTVPLEDGAVFDLSIVPQLVSERTELSGLLNRDRLRGRVFNDLRISAELPRDRALVVVGTAPDAPDREEDPEGPGGRGSADEVGPPASLPPTIGELLLTDGAAVPPRRIMLALRVRLPDTLFPGDGPTAGSPAEPERSADRPTPAAGETTGRAAPF